MEENNNVYLVWVTLDDYPYSMLVAACLTEEDAENIQPQDLYKTSDVKHGNSSTMLRNAVRRTVQKIPVSIARNKS